MSDVLLNDCIKLGAQAQLAGNYNRAIAKYSKAKSIIQKKLNNPALTAQDKLKYLNKLQTIWGNIINCYVGLEPSVAITDTNFYHQWHHAIVMYHDYINKYLTLLKGNSSRIGFNSSAKTLIAKLYKENFDIVAIFIDKISQKFCDADNVTAVAMIPPTVRDIITLCNNLVLQIKKYPILLCPDSRVTALAQKLSMVTALVYETIADKYLDLYTKLERTLSSAQKINLLRQAYKFYDLCTTEIIFTWKKNTENKNILCTILNSLGYVAELSGDKDLMQYAMKLLQSQSKIFTTLARELEYYSAQTMLAAKLNNFSMIEQEHNLYITKFLQFAFEFKKIFTTARDEAFLKDARDIVQAYHNFATSLPSDPYIQWIFKSFAKHIAELQTAIDLTSSELEATSPNASEEETSLPTASESSTAAAQPLPSPMAESLRLATTAIHRPPKKRQKAKSTVTTTAEALPSPIAESLRLATTAIPRPPKKRQKAESVAAASMSSIGSEVTLTPISSLELAFNNLFATFGTKTAAQPLPQPLIADYLLPAPKKAWLIRYQTKQAAAGTISPRSETESTASGTISPRSETEQAASGTISPRSETEPTASGTISPRTEIASCYALAQQLATTFPRTLTPYL